MSQPFIFNTPAGTVYYPVPMFTKAHRRRMDLLLFHFADATFMVQDSEEKLNLYEVSLRINGFVAEPMTARVLDKELTEDG